MRCMLRYSNFLLLAGSLICGSYTQSVDHILTFFLKPSFIAQKNIIESVGVTYGGYFDASDQYGQLVFPRMGSHASFILIITPLIKPIFMLGNTIHHWELIDKLAYQAFSVDRQEQSGNWYWVIAEQKTIRENIIPLNGIVIFGNPQDFSVKIGKTLTTDKPQFILPDVLVHRHWAIYNDRFALGVSTIKNFFEGLTFIHKQLKEAYLSSIQVPR